jgi:hypothetical protein
MKVQEVKNCEDCPFYSNDYYGEFCGIIGAITESRNLIPSDCPLKESPITIKLTLNPNN